MSCDRLLSAVTNVGVELVELIEAISAIEQGETRRGSKTTSVVSHDLLDRITCVGILQSSIKQEVTTGYASKEIITVYLLCGIQKV